MTTAGGNDLKEVRWGRPIATGSVSWGYNLNSAPPKGGGFRLRVKAGSIRHGLTHATRTSSLVLERLDAIPDRALLYASQATSPSNELVSAPSDHARPVHASHLPIPIPYEAPPECPGRLKARVS